MENQGPSNLTSTHPPAVEDSTDNDTVNLRVENALRQIGFVDPDSIQVDQESTQSLTEEEIWPELVLFFDPTGNGMQDIDKDELFRIMDRELDQLEETCGNVRRTGMARWKQLLTQIPYNIVLDILEYIELMVNDNRTLFGYFDRDPTRKCHLIFRALDMSKVLSYRELRKGLEPYMWFIMRHVRHLAVISVECLHTLDQWISTSIESIRMRVPFIIGLTEQQPLCPVIYSTCKSLRVTEIGDMLFKFKNLTHLEVISPLPVTDIAAIRQLPAHSLTSLQMVITTREDILFLLKGLLHLRNLKELRVLGINSENMWDVIVKILGKAPGTLRRLIISQSSWDVDDDKHITITPGMFSSTLTKSVKQLQLQCHLGDLTGLAEFSQLNSLSVLDLDNADQVHNLSSALSLVPSLTELDLSFKWKGGHHDSFSPVLSALTNMLNGLPGLQHLYVTVEKQMVVKDSAMAQFLTTLVQSEVKLHWTMYGSRFSYAMYRTFLTILFHPKLRHLLTNFCPEYDPDMNRDEFDEAVCDMCASIFEIEEWQ